MNRKQISWDDVNHRKFMELYNSGATDREIADVFQLSRNAIACYRRTTLQLAPNDGRVFGPRTPCEYCNQPTPVGHYTRHLRDKHHVVRRNAWRNKKVSPIAVLRPLPNGNFDSRNALERLCELLPRKSA